MNDATIEGRDRGRSAATRRALCLAAEALVAEAGLASLTLRRVAQDAGQGNTAAVSYHFGGLDGLLRAVVDMRLIDSEPARQQMITDMPGGVGAMTGFDVWRCLVWPQLVLPDERVRHAHIRFLAHLSVAGLLSDPFDADVARPGAPSMPLLLARLHETLGVSGMGRARIALCGLMFWNAVMLYDQQALGAEISALGLDALLADVEVQARKILGG